MCTTFTDHLEKASGIDEKSFIAKRISRFFDNGIFLVVFVFLLNSKFTQH